MTTEMRGWVHLSTADLLSSSGRQLTALGPARHRPLPALQACIKSAVELEQAEGVSELVEFHCADATRPAACEELGLTSATLVFLYAYPTLLDQLQVLAPSSGISVYTVEVQ